MPIPFAQCESSDVFDVIALIMSSRVSSMLSMIVLVLESKSLKRCDCCREIKSMRSLQWRTVSIFVNS